MSIRVLLLCLVAFATVTAHSQNSQPAWYDFYLERLRPPVFELSDSSGNPLKFAKKETLAEVEITVKTKSRVFTYRQAYTIYETDFSRTLHFGEKIADVQRGEPMEIKVAVFVDFNQWLQGTVSFDAFSEGSRAIKYKATRDKPAGVSWSGSSDFNWILRKSSL